MCMIVPVIVFMIMSVIVFMLVFMIVLRVPVPMFVIQGESPPLRKVI